MKKVTLVVPVYNGQNYIERFLESVLNQTFTDMQIIIVDDGSTDCTFDILESYRSRMENKFSEYDILKVENGGAASAVNHALKFVKGEYLAWADSDDELFPQNIELKVNFLESNPKYGLVCCEAQAIDQDTGKVLHKLSIPNEKRNENMFLQIIDGIPVYPGVFMIRSELLFMRLKDREIYFNPEAGQNYQLLLPVAYYEKCGFINEVLYNYYVRGDSHSHNVNYEKSFSRTYVREILLEKVLAFLPSQIKIEILRDVHDKSVLIRLAIATQNCDKKMCKTVYKELKQTGQLTNKRRIQFLVSKNKYIYCLVRKLIRIWRCER